MRRDRRIARLAGSVGGGRAASHRGGRPLAFLLALALAVGAACTGDGPDPGDGPSASPTTAAPGAAGPPSGEIRLGVPEEVVSLDPFDARSRTPGSAVVLAAVLPQLFRVDPEGRPVGWLVDDGTIEEGPGVASFRLRPGATWSDGTPVGVADLRFTLDVVRGPAWPGAATGYEAVSGIEADGERIVVRFDPSRTAAAAWRRLFSGSDFVLPAHRLEGADLSTVWREGPDVTAGPFRLAGSAPGLEVVLEAAPAWWGEGPRLSRIRVRPVPDPTTMEQLLERGELEAAWVPPSPNRTARLDAIPGVASSKAAPGGWLVSLVVNTQRLAAERRRAFLGLVPRDRFVDVLLEGEAVRAGSAQRPGQAGPWATWERKGQGRVGEVSLAVAQEEAMGSLLARAVEPAVRAVGGSLELVRADAALVEGPWVREGRFDVSLVDQFQWPEPCARCTFSSEAVGEDNPARLRSVDALAAAADLGDAGALDAFEARLAQEAAVLPLWRPSAFLAFRGLDGVVANSWSSTPLWGAERWRLVR